MVIAIDPGVTTGIAIKAEGRYITTIHRDRFEVWKLLSAASSEATIVIEDFGTNIINTNGLYTVRMIGAVQAIAWLRGCTLVMQRPQFRKPWLNQAKEMLLNEKPFVIHEVDALAHLLGWEYANSR